jgi:hypothetical protein
VSPSPNSTLILTIRSLALALTLTLALTLIHMVTLTLIPSFPHIRTRTRIRIGGGRVIRLSVLRQVQERVRVLELISFISTVLPRSSHDGWRRCWCWWRHIS